MKILRLGLALGTWAYVAALAAVLADASPRAGWPAFVREMADFLFLPAPVLVILALACRARMALLAATVPVALFAWSYGVQFAPRDPVAPTDPPFRVMSFNTGAARGLGPPGPILSAIRAVDPDIVCLVEARGDSLTTIGGPLAGAYPYRVSSSEVFVFSRFPLLDVRRGLVQVGAHDSLLVDVEIRGQLVALAVVHLLRFDAYQGMASGPMSLRRVAGTFDPAPRDRATAELASELRRVGGARILVGDFNMTPWSRSYAQVRSELGDSFAEVGRGFGHTFPSIQRTIGVDATIPLLRIDYVFHSTDLAAVRAWVGPPGGSDHLPIVADLAFQASSAMR